MAQPSEAWRPSFNDAPGSVGAALVWALSQFCNKVFPAPAPPWRASCGAVKNLILSQLRFSRQFRASEAAKGRESGQPAPPWAV